MGLSIFLLKMNPFFIRILGCLMSLSEQGKLSGRLLRVLKILRMNDAFYGTLNMQLTFFFIVFA